MLFRLVEVVVAAAVVVAAVSRMMGLGPSPMETTALKASMEQAEPTLDEAAAAAAARDLEFTTKREEILAEIKAFEDASQQVTGHRERPVQPRIRMESLLEPVRRTPPPNRVP